jgi:hypothetical protein
MTLSGRTTGLLCILAASAGCGGAASAPRSDAPAAPERPAASATKAPFATAAHCVRVRHPLACILMDGLPADKASNPAAATDAMIEVVKGLNRRCRENDQDACAREASLLLVFSQLSPRENAAEKAKSAKQSLEILRTACELGAGPLGCYVLATLTREGELGAKDPSRALRYFARACEGGLAAACYDAGELLEGDELPHADAGEARRFMARGCELGSPFACTHEGFALAGGRLVERTEAAPLFVRACDGGDDDGCGGLGVLLVRGDGIGRDVTRGLALVRAACARGSVWSCARIPVLAAQAEGASAPSAAP